MQIERLIDKILKEHIDCTCYLNHIDESEEDDSSDWEDYLSDTTEHLQNYQEYEEEEETFNCESCDKEFYSMYSFNKHMEQHTTCGVDGCTFNAHEKIIEKHIRMQHSTGLYDKIRNINTPEDIAKWIEERKKRYPSKVNIQLRYQKQEEMLKRGERIGERRNRFNRDNTRLKKADPPYQNGNSNSLTVKSSEGAFKKRKPRTFTPTKEKPTKSIIDEKEDWNGNMFPFKGTKELYVNEDDVDAKNMSDYEDEEWGETNINKKPKLKFNNALGALMGAYMSDDCESSEDEPNKNVNSSVIPPVVVPLKVNKEEHKSDDDAPLEVKIEKVPLENESQSEVKLPQEEVKRKRVRNNRTSNTTKKNNFKRRKVNNYRSNDNFPYQNFRKRRVTLLEKLLDKDIRHERNVILQCVRHIVSNDFFRKKEDNQSTNTE